MADGRALDVCIDRLYGAMNRLTSCYLLKPFVIRRAAFVNPGPSCDPAFHAVVLDQPTLLRHAAEPEADLTDTFVRSACARGDRCYAMLHHGALASYAWRSTQSTHAMPGVQVEFRRGWIYTYKALTLPRYRGLRLHAWIKAHMLEDDAAGSEGLLGCVEINNVASMRSFVRSGATSAGLLIAMRVNGAYRTFRTRRAATLGIGLGACRGCGDGCGGMPANLSL